jgi:hypothetical protein
MIRTCLLFLLICCAKISFGQDNVPVKALQVPDGNKQLIHAYAKGLQVYTCVQDTKDTANFIWILKEPLAKLYPDSAYKHRIGKHYFTNGAPTWQSKDGSTVIGAKLAQVNSPDSTAIPWLLLKIKLTNGTGVLSGVTYIQRVNTKGGKAPLAANKKLKGHLLKVPYTAEYLFYVKS